MKAAVIHQLGQIPQYEEIADPIIADNQVIAYVKAASIKNLDKSLAKGSHYDHTFQFPAIMGVDGVVQLEDGSRVYTGAKAPYGMLAEKTVIRPGYTVPVPDGLDDVTAAALPNPAASAWMALAWRGQFKKGDNVLILGATGVTGKLAIQIARHWGANKIFAAGRDENKLAQLKTLGATETISLSQPEEEIIASYQQIAKEVDIVMDYLWGRPAEILLEALTGHDLHAEGKVTRYIHIGGMAGQTITLPGAVLRSTGLELVGSGGGSISKEAMRALYTDVVPEIFQLAAEGKLLIDTEIMPLASISEAWEKADGKRIVIQCS
ncbi:zinc-binding alcohol dehydrogenase family protein [Mucilaginibacter ximonensis]|uniref:Zinc-binding alcohol dehydrogenase family protein n=1 Tax=Mucilaginibacter ximonensis TaxID=538021 RepID=A0ABW5Y9U5_9SPHI